MHATYTQTCTHYVSYIIYFSLIFSLKLRVGEQQLCKNSFPIFGNFYKSDIFILIY